jgi:queuine tRNA-ribosyltransferase
MDTPANQWKHQQVSCHAKHFDKTNPKYGYSQTLFPPIVHDLRVQSGQIPVLNEGNIGGLSVGEPAEMMYAKTTDIITVLPKAKPLI